MIEYYKKENPFSNVKCAKLKKFIGEDCSTDSDCYSGLCKFTKCSYLPNGELCQFDSQCGEKSYCGDNATVQNKTCMEYQITEGSICGAIQCSPQFSCEKEASSSNKKCQ